MSTYRVQDGRISEEGLLEKMLGFVDPKEADEFRQAVATAPDGCILTITMSDENPNELLQMTLDDATFVSSDEQKARVALANLCDSFPRLKIGRTLDDLMKIIKDAVLQHYVVSNKNYLD